MARIKKNENFLDYVPVRNPEFEWKVKKNGRVEITVIHKGFFSKIAQLFFHKPKASHIALDEFGTYVWLQIDGNTDVYGLSKKMKEHFGEKAEPILERLVQFIKILQTNRYITYKK